jgi:predicted DNA-binding ribbon-helix-helix protein
VAGNRYLAIFLDDQLALAVGWRELARRAARENHGTELAEPLAKVAHGMAEDVETLKRLMAQLGARRSRWKQAAAVLAERGGRLKPNGRVRSYSPLSRFVELEFLAIGIEAKRQLWRSLRDFAQIDGVDFDALIARADEQRAEIEPLRVAAGAVLRT